MKIKNKEKIVSVGQSILMVVGLVGFVFIAAAAGNAVQLLKYTPLMKRSKIKLYEINRSIQRLKDRGLIKIKENQDYKFIEVSETGKKLLWKYELEGLATKKQVKWDGQYRVIIFDISEIKRNVRDKLRRAIRGFGFIGLQDSVWVYPYPCEDIIELLKRYLELKSEVIYMTVNTIQNDNWLKKNFDLK